MFKMLEHTHLKTFLSKAYCRRCGTSLDTADLVPISEMPLGLVAHAVCISCKSENMVTITTLGAGVLPLTSDLSAKELKRFVHLDNVSYEDVLALHKKLRKDSICKLLQKKEQNTVRIQKN